MVCVTAWNLAIIGLIMVPTTVSAWVMPGAAPGLYPQPHRLRGCESRIGPKHCLRCPSMCAKRDSAADAEMPDAKVAKPYFQGGDSGLFATMKQVSTVQSSHQAMLTEDLLTFMKYLAVRQVACQLMRSTLLLLC